MERTEDILERYELGRARILEIKAETGRGCLKGAYGRYFYETAAFLEKITECFSYIEEGGMARASLEELKLLNRSLYQDVLPENYGASYANPAYAAECCGEEYGQLLSFLYAELRSLIPFAFEQDRYALTIRMELFLEVYSAFDCAYGEKGQAPEYRELQQIIYWFVSDYSEPEAEKRLREQLCPEEDFALRIILDSDLTDLRYLYYFGEYITDKELETAEYLNSMSEEAVRQMANTYTEGYRIGFRVCNKDITKKNVVNIRYSLGFERMIRAAVENFAAMGMDTTICRAGASIFRGRGIQKNGYFGASPNRQYEYDHKEDQALYLDSRYVNRRLEGMRAAYERLKKEAAGFGGPAVVEIFGETPFVPEAKRQVLRLSEKQQRLSVEYAAAAGALQNEYIPGEERSFTIIAFPTPAIGSRFKEIFEEVVRINTLDYELYQRLQQRIIDALDQADYVHIKGRDGNRTDLRVQLHKLKDPAAETNFENCVADVNIPAGEIFTSPVLKGTEGVLHVSRVFLRELEYRDLELTFRDGMVAAYTCRNFETEEENRKYIRDNILFHHETLPMGEFAIGTNTTAYMAAKKYGIEHKLPILIAEKMGPHFAVGDTCYSHEEDVITFNPDGKAIVARENEVSALRSTDMERAYFNCHTDITLPYDELGELAGIAGDGGRIPVIREGRFVLEGCEELNRPFD